MSEDQDSIVTKEYLDQMLAGVMERMEQRADDKRQKEFASLMAAISAENKPILEMLNQHTEAINRIFQQGQPKEEKEGGERKMRLEDHPLFEKFTDKIMNKYFNDDDNPASDVDFQSYKKNIHTLYNLGIKRAIQVTDKLILKELKPTANSPATKLAASMIESDLGDRHTAV